jgi:hypothetical protein
VAVVCVGLLWLGRTKGVFLTFEKKKEKKSIIVEFYDGNDSERRLEYATLSFLSFGIYFVVYQ